MVRTAKKCRERWVNVLNPDLVKSDFSAEEDRIILKMQAKIGNRWSKIAHMLNGRSDISVKNRFVKLTFRQNKRPEDYDFKENSDDDSYYKDVTAATSAETEAAIALTEFTKNTVAYESSSDVKLPLDILPNFQTSPNTAKVFTKRSWNSSEDKSLKQYVSTYGENNWKLVSYYVPNRTQKQCRERWFMALDPKIKRDEWSSEEDEIVLKKQKEIGNKWVDIAKLLPGRVKIAVKNRFYKLMRIQGKNCSKSSEGEDDDDDDDDNDEDEDCIDDEEEALEEEKGNSSARLRSFLTNFDSNNSKQVKSSKRQLDSYDDSFHILPSEANKNMKLPKMSDVDQLIRSQHNNGTDIESTSLATSCNASSIDTSLQDPDTFKKLRMFDNLLPSDHISNVQSAMATQLPPLSMLLQQQQQQQHPGMPSMMPYGVYPMAQYPMMPYPPQMMGYSMLPFPYQGPPSMTGPRANIVSSVS